MSAVRYCRRCETEKPRDAFGTRTVGGRDYPQTYCRDCATHYVQQRRKTSAGKATIRDYGRSAYARARHKVLARQKAQYAVKTGRIQRGPCEVGVGCKGGIEAHHDDYSRPLDVRWLCRKHHAEAERSVSSPIAIGEDR